MEGMSIRMFGEAYLFKALNDLVSLGKVRHIGASSMHAWQFQKMNDLAKERGWATFTTMQVICTINDVIGFPALNLF